MQFNDGNISNSRGPNDGSRGPDMRNLAVLDAMGMLDEVDAAQFDRAFADLPPSQQAELRELQAAAVVDPAFLSNEQPSDDLKLRTLTRVMTAVEQQESDFAPIAHIGRTATRPNRQPVRSIDANDLVSQAMELASLRKDAERFARSSYVWRAAAIALIAALTVALVFEVSTHRLAMKISQFALGGASPKQIFDSLGEDGSLQNFQRASFLRGLSGSGSLTLAVDTVSGRVHLLLVGGDPNSSYVLRHTSETGFKTEIGNFVAHMNPWGADIAVSVATAKMLQSGSLELIKMVDGQETVVMRS